LVPKPIAEQVQNIAKIFKLDPELALKYATNLPSLPEGAEGWFAIPKVSSVVTEYVPKTAIQELKYAYAVGWVVTELAKSRSFDNRCIGDLVTRRFSQHPRTLEYLNRIEDKQAGDILIIAAQFGLLHRGESIRRARKIFMKNEFGLDAFTIGCMILMHPLRFGGLEKLGTACAGDEIIPNSESILSYAPVYNNDLDFYADDISKARYYIGSASGFVHAKV
jgi:hypothetical protein